MGGVADEDHPAGVPGVEFDPFDRADVELLIALQGGEVRRDRPAEAGEAAPEPFQPSRQGVVEALGVDAGEAVRPAADRDQPEEASLPHEHHELGHTGRWMPSAPTTRS